jgi:hypothetical protein
VYGETGQAVQTVIVNGEVVLDGGHPTRFDPAPLVAEAHERGARLRERALPHLARARELHPYLEDAYLALIREFEGR